MDTPPQARFRHSQHTPPTQRVGDLERDIAVEELMRHYAEGRLVDEEMDERIERAMIARTREDLYVLLSDLPRPSGVPRGGAQGRVPTVRERLPSSLTLAIDVSIVLVTIASTACLLLLLFASLHSFAAAWAWFAAIGATVSTAGMLHIWNRLIKPRHDAR